MQEDAEVRELCEQIRGLPKDAGHYEQIRLGELVGQALARRQAADGERLIDKLTSFAEAVVTRKPAHDDEVADAAFLVPLDRRAEFERALDELAVEWADRIRLRLLGPLPPYDFVGSSEAQET